MLRVGRISPIKSRPGVGIIDARVMETLSTSTYSKVTDLLVVLLSVVEVSLAVVVLYGLRKFLSIRI